MLYRNLSKLDPFQQLKRSIQARLVRLEQEILSQYQPGQKRQLVQNTVRLLLGMESTTQGKIKRLLAITQFIGTHNHPFLGIIDDSLAYDKPCSSQANPNVQKDKAVQRCRSQKLIDQSTQHSSHLSMPRYKKSTEQTQNHKLNQQQIIRVKPFLGDSQNRLSSYAFSNLSKSQKQKPFQGNNSQQKQKQSRISGFKQGYQKDLFSFRTQKNLHQTTPSEQKQSPSPKYNSQIKNNFRKSQQKQVQDNPKLRQCGLTESYLWNQNRCSKQSQVFLQMYKKISNRVKVSECVFSLTQHSGEASDINNLVKRYKLQRDSRSQIAKLVVNDLANRSVWK